MNITVHIGQLTIEGAALTRREREHLTVTLERELIRLLGGRGPASAAGDDRNGTAALGSRVAREVLAALPAGTSGRQRGTVLPKTTVRPETTVLPRTTGAGR